MVSKHGSILRATEDAWLVVVHAPHACAWDADLDGATAPRNMIGTSPRQAICCTRGACGCRYIYTSPYNPHAPHYGSHGVCSGKKVQHLATDRLETWRERNTRQYISRWAPSVRCMQQPRAWWLGYLTRVVTLPCAAASSWGRKRTVMAVRRQGSIHRPQLGLSLVH